MPPLKRFPLTTEHKAKISAAKKGVPQPATQREGASRALRGRKKSPETVARMKAAQQARRAFERDAEAVLEASREAAKARRKTSGPTRGEQQLADIHEALRIGRMDLALDIQQSDGWKHRRKVFDARVSDGAVTPGQVSRQERRRALRAAVWG